MTDVVVVGAGITGLSLAFFLTRAGADVRVVDRAGIASGASGVQPGGVRQQWSTEVNCVLARESVEFYAHLDDELGIDTGARLDRCGYLFVAQSDERLAALRADVALQNGHGIPSRIVTADEAGELVPGLVADTIAGAAWCGEDGYFDRPQTVVEAFARAAAIEVEIAEVESATPEALGANAVVVAAGVDTTRFVDLPIAPEQRHLFLSEPIAERLLEPLVVAGERSFAAKQLANGRVLASDLAAAGEAERNRDTWRATVARGIDELLPALAYVSFPVLASGTYDVTPDHQPFVGPVDDGVWVAAGYSGHGFMLAPAISRR
ncbi:MAG: FAD-binding oxidoreductase, partial [Actinobacteria bacterium]|nr:FAD-binding oxidoreductase [Actinomycetota bacterium]